MFKYLRRVVRKRDPRGQPVKVVTPVRLSRSEPHAVHGQANRRVPGSLGPASAIRRAVAERKLYQPFQVPCVLIHYFYFSPTSQQQKSLFSLSRATCKPPQYIGRQDPVLENVQLKPPRASRSSRRDILQGDRGVLGNPHESACAVKKKDKPRFEVVHDHVLVGPIASYEVLCSCCTSCWRCRKDTTCFPGGSFFHQTGVGRGHGWSRETCNGMSLPSPVSSHARAVAHSPAGCISLCTPVRGRVVWCKQANVTTELESPPCTFFWHGGATWDVQWRDIVRGGTRRAE